MPHHKGVGEEATSAQPVLRDDVAGGGGGVARSDSVGIGG